MLRKSSLENAFDTTYVQKHYFEGKCSGNRYFKMHLTPCMYKIVAFEGNWKGNRHLKMHLTPNMYKIITLMANAKEIITVKSV